MQQVGRTTGPQPQGDDFVREAARAVEQPRAGVLSDPAAAREMTDLLLRFTGLHSEEMAFFLRASDAAPLPLTALASPSRTATLSSNATASPLDGAASLPDATPLPSVLGGMIKTGLASLRGQLVDQNADSKNPTLARAAGLCLVDVDTLLAKLDKEGVTMGEVRGCAPDAPEHFTAWKALQPSP